MKKSKLTAVLVAAACIGCLAGCEKKGDITVPETPDSASATAPVIGGSELSGDKYNADEYEKKINEIVEKAEVSDSQPQLGSVGELIAPKDGSEEFDLGSYRVSSSGVKLYYDETEFPEKLVLTLEKYFSAFPAADYSSYTGCVFPSYIDEMEAFLEKDFQYDLKSSFIKQCSSLAGKMNGDYRVTRIKLETAPQYSEDADNLETYFSSLDEAFGKKYYEQVKSECDNIIDACFYVMAEDSSGKETMMVSGYEIVFAEKDGRYYTFG